MPYSLFDPFYGYKTTPYPVHIIFGFSGYKTILKQV